MVLPMSASAGDPETCTYRERALADACRRDPEVRAYLLEPANTMVETLRSIPPVVRGWLPGEEEAVLGLIQNQQSGCGYTDQIVAAACKYDPMVKEALERSPAGASSIWFNLPFDVGGWAPSMTNSRYTRPYNTPGADQMRQNWTFDRVSNGERLRLIGQAMKRATGTDVEFVKAHLVAVDATNFIACGYGFFNEAGTITSGLFVFDSRGGSALRAPQSLFREKCLYADKTLR